ncbi:MAG: Asp-tRNA(Asn)/Glu-tRNA(Gln) amidotransferase subunit GatC [Clostridiaceae bacterium]|nr:Asp-tRNA(Asn)/Glu-tRNA(Gln) amidotransferase subunit GatC [Clostridiaceae bacterium]
MKVTVETIKHVAKLSRLDLSEEEILKFAKDMESIVEYVDKLNELDTTDVEPTAHVVPVKNVQRKDEVNPSFERGSILLNAPMEKDGCFKVPRIVE